MKILLAFLLLPGIAAAAPTDEKIDLGAGRSAVVAVPDTWKRDALPARPPGIPNPGATVQYVPRREANEAVLITLLTVPDDRLADPESVRALAELSARRFVAGSVEGKVDLKAFKVGGRAGYACTFTDASLVGKPPVKDDYKAMTACYVYLGDRVMLTATIFSDDPAGEAYATARRMIQSITLSLPQNTI